DRDAAGPDSPRPRQHGGSHGLAVRSQRARPRHPAPAPVVPPVASRGIESADLAVRILARHFAQRVPADRGPHGLARARSAVPRCHHGSRFRPGAGCRDDVHPLPGGREPGCRPSSLSRRPQNPCEMRMRKLQWTLLVFLGMLHGAVLLAAFLTPYHFAEQHRDYPFAPPTRLHFVDWSGGFHWRPFVYRLTYDSSTATYQEDAAQTYPLQFFVRSRLFGVSEPAAIFLLG